jgi:hypothetical protein
MARRVNSTNPDHSNLEASSSKKLRFEFLNPNQIKINAKNWRIHPRRQRQAYNAFKQQVGWAGAVLINETTGNLLDGHMRVDEAIKNKETQVPCLIGAWTEEKENLILQSLDPLGSLASTDKEALASLTEANRKKLTNLSDDNTRRLAQLTQDLQAVSQAEDGGPLIKQSKAIRKPSSSQEIIETEDLNNTGNPDDELDVSYQPPTNNKDIRREIIESDVFFQSDDYAIAIPLQLPSLLEDMLATPDMTPRQTFDRSRSQEHTSDTYYCISSTPFPLDREGGVLGFFTEDYRFNNCYDFASHFLEELLEEDWAALMLPDYSLFDHFPLPMKLWNLYRSRWCGRYWQEAGFKVIPIIQACQLGSESEASMTRPLCIDTLPDYTPVVACQMRSNAAYQDFCEDINYAVETKSIETVIIYGGLDRQKVIHGYLTDKAEIIYLPSFIKARKQAIKKGY